MKSKRNPKKGSSPAAVKARQREEVAIALRAEGKTLQEIADAVGYSSREGARLALMRAMERLPPIEDIERLRQQEVAITREIEAESWLGWDKSCEDLVTRTETGTKNGTFATTRRETQCGDPALLGIILRASERRARLLGLDAPTKAVVEAEGEVRVIGVDPLELFEAQAAKLRAARAAK
jgi:hypothetical protein